MTAEPPHGAPSPSPDVQPSDAETLDHLSGPWRIFQLRRGGHRFSTDDVLVAWTALQRRPGARRLLDLGSGLGSVGLITLRHLRPEARMVALEVQPVSVALARKTLAYNGLQQRVTLRQGDLREPRLLAGEAPFDLITANPPYLPPGSASRSPHPQRAAARLELHGDVFDYCAVAARHLGPGGRFCFCHSARDQRPERAVERAGLSLLCRREVCFRAGKAPTIALFVCARRGARRDQASLHIRTRAGRWSAPYLRIREKLQIGAYP